MVSSDDFLFSRVDPGKSKQKESERDEDGDGDGGHGRETRLGRVYCKIRWC